MGGRERGGREGGREGGNLHMVETSSLEPTSVPPDVNTMSEREGAGLVMQYAATHTAQAPPSGELPIIRATDLRASVMHSRAR